MRILTLTLAGAAALGIAGSATAGGYSAPVIAAPPEPVVIAPTIGPWQGGYVGGSIGYALQGDDEVGLQAPGAPEPVSFDTLELRGANAELRAGYRWQRQQWVIGPELSILGGNIEDDIDSIGEVTSQVNHVADLKLKTGYEVQPNTLIFGTIGASRGDFTYTVAGTDYDYDASGYVLGLGAERKINDRTSITGEWEFRDFGTTDVDVVGGTTVATPSFHNLKVGVNFQF